NICIDLQRAAEYDEFHDEGFDKDIFVARIPDNRRFVSFRDLLNSDLAVYNTVPDRLKPTFQKATGRFSSYPFSVVWVRDQPLGEVVEIFQRINQGGKRLSGYDLVCANLWTEDFTFRREVEHLIQQVSLNNFGVIDARVVPQTISLILYGRMSQSNQLNMTTKQVEDIWDDVTRAFVKAIDFARTNLGVQKASFFPYSGIIPVLTYCFYQIRNQSLSAEQRQILWNWFWGVSLSERYGSTSQTRIAEDVNKLTKALVGEEVTFDYESRVTKESVSKLRMLSQTSSVRNAILCMLSLRQPKNFKDGTTINLNSNFFDTLTKAERHHIFSVNYVRKNNNITNRDVHLIANFAFIPAELNWEISKEDPSSYMTLFKEKNPSFESDAASNLIRTDNESAIWRDDFYIFIEQRSKLIADALNGLLEADVVSDSVYKGREYEIVKRLETQLRDLIDERLSAVAGTRYWKQLIPFNVRTSVDEHIKAHLEKRPYEDMSMYPPGRKRLDFCFVSDYEQIISKNWSHFEDIFRNKHNFITHNINLRKLRNATAHNNLNTLDKVDESLINAAVVWIQQCIDAYYDRQDAIDDEDVDDVEDTDE
ncbi:MAG: hypothetical protein KDE51_07255, partial [Anaerolineales bacterium]|nr:hypothetical protein [Anaerolineales bacterium]